MNTWAGHLVDITAKADSFKPLELHYSELLKIKSQQ